MTLHRRWYNVVSTLRAGWILFLGIEVGADDIDYIFVDIPIFPFWASKEFARPRSFGGTSTSTSSMCFFLFLKNKLHLVRNRGSNMSKKKKKKKKKKNSNSKCGPRTFVGPESHCMFDYFIAHLHN